MNKRIAVFATLLLTACAPATDTNRSTGMVTDSPEVTVNLTTDPIETAATGLFLTQGDPANFDPPYLYEGNISLTGWMVMTPRYVGEAVPHFQPNIDSLKEIPFNHEGPFYVEGLTEQQELQLMKSTSANPVTLDFSKLTVNIEGSPTLTAK